MLDIGEVTAQSGVAPSALRFYERRGLLQSAGRNGLRRTFDPDVLNRLALIGCAQAAGFTLSQIGRFIAATPDDSELRIKLAEKADELDHEIERLTRMRDSLRHAAVCTHTPLVGCPEFKIAIAEPLDGEKPAHRSGPLHAESVAQTGAGPVSLSL